jgi:hypothetical protein
VITYDFVERFCHYDLIRAMSCEEFVKAYNDWADNNPGKVLL